MYSYEERIKAVQLYIKFDKSAASVINELGYPKSTKSIKYWYEEYIANGDLHKDKAVCIPAEEAYDRRAHGQIRL